MKIIGANFKMNFKKDDINNYLGFIKDKIPMESIIFFIPSRILQSLLLLSVIRLRENLNTWETFISRTEGYTVRILRIGSFLTQLCWWTMTAGFTFMLEVDSHPMVILGTRLKDYL